MRLPRHPRGGRVFAQGREIAHREDPLRVRIHWRSDDPWEATGQASEYPLENATNNPLEHATESPLENITEIHNDF